MPAEPRPAKEIFLAAVELTAPAARAAFLDQACAGDPALRSRVEALLRAHDEPAGGSPDPAATSAFEHGHDGGAEVRPAPRPAEGPGGRIGPYKLLQQIGEGGMGTVFMAEQEHPVRRRVAVKLVKPGMDSAAVVARFEAERQALALMDHPNIARVLDAGATDAGRPYFVMELVNGIPITRYCDENKLTPRERLGLFVPVCQAIQHAHQKGVIHRDVKPSNVLVTLYDGRPVPKVIDFGIAKATEQRLTDRTMFTQFGMAVGTFEYMAPEQAELSGLGVDTRADVYSLGVLLYELLTGTTPLEANRLRGVGYSEAVRLIREEEAPTPSRRLSTSAQLQAVAAARRTDPGRLARLVRGELDWIVMRCLEKDRTRRYGSAEALARDVERYLHDEPVEACPPSVWYRTRKHAAGLVTVAVLAAALVAGAAVSAWQAVRAAGEAERAREQATRADREAERAAGEAQRAREQAGRADREAEKAVTEAGRATRAQDGLRAGMTRQVAERIQGDLGRFAAVGDALAATATRLADPTEDGLRGWMEELLRREPRIFGLCLAYEPEEGPGRRQDYHLYLCRRTPRSTAVIKKTLEYEYRKEDWYRQARERQRPVWTEPFVDTGGGDIPMVSYAAPLKRGDRFVGVLTVDLSLGYFDQLREWLATDLNFGPHSYGFVLSQAGNVLSHPDPNYDFGRRFEAGHKSAHRITDPGGTDPAFSDLAGRLRGEKGGQGHATAPATGRPVTYLFARVQLDRTQPDREWWTFVAVIEE